MTRLAGRKWSSEVGGDVRNGGPSTFEVLLAPGGDPVLGAAAQADVLAAFLRLTRAGGMGGSQLDPVRSSLANRPIAPAVAHGASQHWSLPGLSVDPLAPNVLFNLIECTALVAPVASARLLTDGSDATPAGSLSDDYPGAYHSLPFAAEAELQGRNVSVEVEFEQTLSPEQIAELREGLEAWEQVLAAGGFRFADLAPWESVGGFSGAWNVTGDYWAVDLEKVTAHPAAFDSLLNVLARFSLSTAAIQTVRIQS